MRMSLLKDGCDTKIVLTLSDDTFCAGLLLHSWYKADLLPELGVL